MTSILRTIDVFDLMDAVPAASQRGCELFALHGACFHRSIENLGRLHGKRRSSADAHCAGK